MQRTVNETGAGPAPGAPAHGGLAQGMPAQEALKSESYSLTRFPLFFPEKRDVFLRGSDTFEFGLGLGRDIVPFFSRRIGLLDGQDVPIVLGGKLTGRVNRTNLGALVVRTGDGAGAPGTTMAVGRVEQLRLRLNFSPDMTLSSFIQHDNISDSLGTSTRWRWRFHPGRELFVVYTHNFIDRLDGGLRTDSTLLLVKLNYDVRL